MDGGVGDSRYVYLFIFVIHGTLDSYLMFEKTHGIPASPGYGVTS